MARLEITHPKFGTWKQASVDLLRPAKNRALAKKKGWLVDDEGYVANGLAIDPFGRNRYTKQPVDSNGRTFEVWLVAKSIMERFPDAPQTNGGAVDRNRRKSRSLSKHAKSEAIDVITRKWDGNLKITPFDQAKGRELFDWLLAEAKDGRLPLDMILFNGRIAKRSEGWVERAVNPGTDPHRDHLHTDVRVADRRNSTTPPPQQARRTLRYRSWLPRMKGADVELVQRTIGAPVGSYGPDTAAAVKVWQRAQGLIADGVVGPQTWARIDEVTAP